MQSDDTEKRGVISEMRIMDDATADKEIMRHLALDNQALRARITELGKRIEELEEELAISDQAVGVSEWRRQECLRLKASIDSMKTEERDDVIFGRVLSVILIGAIIVLIAVLLTGCSSVGKAVCESPDRYYKDGACYQREHRR